MNKFTVIHSYQDEIEVEKVADRNCPPKMAYLITDQTSFVQLVRGMYELQKDQAEWIRRYDNALKGLRYWQAKAMERE